MNRSKFVMFLGPLLGLIVGIWIGMTVSKWSSSNNVGSETAVRGVNITIDAVQRDELFSQLRNFAEKWHYAILIDEIEASPTEDFRIQMWRGDMKILGMYPTDPGVFSFGFFNTQPSVKMPERYFDEEIADLKLYINEIPGATLEVDR